MSPDRGETYLTDVSVELVEATTAVDQLVTELVTDVSNELDAGISLLHITADELIGSVDQEERDVETQLNKVLNRLIGDVSKTLATMITDLQSVGTQVPWSAQDMATETEGDWIQMLANAYPTIAPILGISPPTAIATADDQFWDSNGSPPPIRPSYDDSSLGFVPSVPLTTSQPSNYEPSPGPSVGDYPASLLSPLVSPPPGVPYTPSCGCGPAKPQPCGCPAPVVNVTCPAPGAAPAQAPIYVNFQTPGTLTAPTGPQVTIPGLSPPPPPPTLPPGTTVYPGVLPPYPGTSTQTLPGQYPPTAPQPGFTPPTSPGASTPAHSLLLLPSITGVGATSTRDGINWNDAEACHFVAVATTNPATNLAPEQNAPKKPFLDTYLDSKLSWRGLGGVLLGPFGAPVEMDILRRAWAESDGGTTNTIESWANRLAQETALATVTPQAVANKSAAAYFGARLALAEAGQSNTHFPLMYLYQSDQYAFQYANPQYLPNQIRVDSAFLANTIDDHQWVCWTRANGNLPEPARKAMLADQVRPGVRDLIDLSRRGYLKPEDLYKRVREMGVLDPSYMREFQALMIALPTQSDLISFMVRDAADDAVAAEYGYDEGFGEKYTGQMKQWAAALGLDETYFKYSWRSHWRTPSYTQLSEMYARLRPDRPEVTDWYTARGDQPDDVEVPGIGPKPPTVSLDQVRKALQVDDMAPGWVDKLIAISTTPINRTDAVRAFMIGAFDSDRLYHAFRDVGYSERDAKTLVTFYSQDKARRNRNVSGVWSMRKILRYYKTAAITREDAFELIRPLQPSNKATDEVLDAADAELAADVRATRLRGLKRGYMLGEFDQRATVELMRKWGMDPAQAERTLTVWDIERASRFKQPTVAMLSKWLKTGIISVEEMRARLVNLGYKQVDADRIIASALKWNFGDEPPSPDELSEAITEHVKSQKDASTKSNSWLAQAAKAAERTLRKIREEQKRRLPAEQRPSWNPLTIP